MGTISRFISMLLKLKLVLLTLSMLLNHNIQGESKKTDTFDIQMNNKGVSFFLLTLYTR
jgi:hypothetical protein